MSGKKIKLHLRFDGPTQPSSPGEAFGAMIDIHPLAGRDAQAQRAIRQQAIPSGSVSRAFDVAPGRYLVEALLPNGGVISKEIDLGVDSADSVVVDLEDEATGPEWLKWHRYLGHVGSDAPSRAPDTRGVLEHFAPDPDSGHPITIAKRVLESALGLESLDSPPRADVHLLHPPADGGLAWSLDLDRWTRGALAVSPTRAAGHALYRFAPGTLGASERWYALVRDRAMLTLATLPSRWASAEDGRELPVELLIGEGQRSEAPAVSVSDGQTAPILGYLARGDLPTAANVVAQSKGLLAEKVANPLGAAAGTYVLLGTEKDRTHRPWHDWVRNLMDFFPWMPDGAVAYAWLMLRHQTSEDHIEQAKMAVELALARGIPYYTAGLRLLCDSLTMLADEIEDGEDKLRLVRRATARADRSRAFVTLRMGGS